MATSTLGSGTLVLAGTTSGTTTVTATAVAGTTTLTLPAATDTLVGRATTDTLTNKTLTGAAMNGTLGATTPSTASVTTLTTSSTVTHSGGTANGVAYLDGSKVLTTGSALTFDGTNLGVGAATPTAKLQISVASAAVDGTKGVRITNPAGTVVMLECGSGGDSFVGTTSGSDFNIRTNNITRATFDNAGNLLVGTTSNVNTAKSVVAFSSGAGGSIEYTGGTGATNMFIFRNTNGNVGAIYTSGSATTYSTSSDYRLKNSIAPMTGALAKVAALKPVTYKWNVDDTTGEGFIAHELAEVCPQAVVGEKDAVDEDGNPVYQGIDTSFLVATLTAALQELKAEVDSLKAQINGASA